MSAHPDERKRAVTDAWHRLTDASRRMIAADVMLGMSAVIGDERRIESALTEHNEAQKELRTAAWTYTDAYDAAAGAIACPDLVRRWGKRKP